MAGLCSAVTSSAPQLEGAALNNRGGSALLRRAEGRRHHVLPQRFHRTRRGPAPGSADRRRLYFDGAKLSNPGGRALVASRLTWARTCSAASRSPRTRAAVSVEGAVNLRGAHIGGQPRLRRGEAAQRLRPRPARRQPASRPGHAPAPAGSPPPAAASAARSACPAPTSAAASTVTGRACATTPAPPCTPTACRSTRACSSATGSPPPAAASDGAVHLIGAHIGGHLDCTGADLRNDSGPALDAYSLQVGQGMYLTGGFTATGGGDGVAVNLTGARVGGTFVFDPARLEHTADSHQRLAVDGLTYAGVPEPISAQGWRELLRDGTPSYAAQPYQQLAAGYRALGDDRQARQTLMAQRDDQLARTDTRWPERLWGRITKVTLGYGYQPWRALLFLAAVVARVLRACGRARRAWCAGANQQDGDPGPVVHGGSAGQRGTGSQPAGGHQRGPGGLRPDQGFGQCDRGLADRCRLGACGYWRGCSRRCSSPASPAPYARHDLCAVARTKRFGYDGYGAADRSAVSTVTTLTICPAVCAPTTLEALLDAACPAATASRPDREGGRHPGPRSR